MAEKLRIGLVSGIRHQDDYAPFFARHPDVILVGLADDADISEEYHALNRDLADQFALEYTTDLDAFLARDDVDAVCVAPEYARHTPLALRAIAANKHVLVDKPIGTTLEQCDALIAAATQVHAHVRLDRPHRSPLRSSGPTMRWRPVNSVRGREHQRPLPRHLR